MIQGVEHFPEEPIERFIEKSLMRTKPSGFVKAIKPNIGQMPLVLKIAQRLYEIGYKELGQSIALAVFVQRISIKPDVNNSQLQYSAIEAWSLLSEYNLDLLPTQYMSAAKSRLKSSLLYRDSMTMIMWACGLEKNRGVAEAPSERIKKNALSFLPVVLKDLIEQHEYGNYYINFLCNAYHQIVITPEIHELFYTWFERLLISEKRGNNKDVLKFLDDNYPDRKEKNWELWRFHKGNVVAQNVFLLNLFNSNNNYVGKDSVYIQSILEHYDLNDFVSVLLTRALYIFDFEKSKKDFLRFPGQTQAELKSVQEKEQLRVVETYLNLLTALCSKIKNNKKFELLACAALMSYIHMCKTSNIISDHYKPFNQLFPNLLDQPLPLLAALYPEQQTLINDIRKELYLSMKLESNYTSNLNLNIIHKYYDGLYSTLSGVLFEREYCNESTIQTLCNVGDLSVFEYFLNVSQEHIVNFDGLNESVFNF